MTDYTPYIAGLRTREAYRNALHEERRQRAISVAKRIANMLRDDFGAIEIFLFGSTLRKDEYHAQSDIDLAVTGIASEKYFAAVGKALIWGGEFSVDLLELNSCRPRLKEAIHREGIEL